MRPQRTVVGHADHVVTVLAADCQRIVSVVCAQRITALRQPALMVCRTVARALRTAVETAQLVLMVPAALWAQIAVTGSAHPMAPARQRSVMIRFETATRRTSTVGQRARLAQTTRRAPRLQIAHQAIAPAGYVAPTQRRSAATGLSREPKPATAQGAMGYFALRTANSPRSAALSLAQGHRPNQLVPINSNRP